MKPLTVQVDIPSSSAMVLKPKKNGKENYEVVNYGEITFPNNWHSKRLGRGSYGTVIECFFRGRPAAAKLVENGNDHSQIRSEAELLHGFSHANIVKLYALFHGEMSGLVLELMEGRSLSELLHQGKHITYQACHALHWANQVCEALCYLHAHNYIHRDIKPSNMLLTRDYKTLKLCDFGTVAELKTSMTDNRGTAAWMAPEVFRGRRYDQKCDIFSFGISFWEMVTRRQPFTDLNETNPVTLLWKVAENGLRPPRISDLPKPLMDLIERCWQNDPEERPCLEEVKRIIEAFIEIFPNAKLLPLVDRTTAKQALAQSTWEKYRNMQSSGVSAPPTPPTTIPLPPLSTYYAAAPQLPPTINVQNSPSPVPNHLPPLPHNLLHSTQSQIIIHRPVGQQLLPIPGQANPYFPHQQSGLHLPHPNPIHLSHSLMDITSSPSSTYQPCRTSPSFMPPNNYPVNPINRATSLPPPNIQDESQLGQEKKCKKSYIRRWIRGLKNF